MSIRVLTLLYGPWRAGKSTLVRRANDAEIGMPGSAIDLESWQADARIETLRRLLDGIIKTDRMPVTLIGMADIPVTTGRRETAILPRRYVVVHKLLLPPYDKYLERKAFADSMWPAEAQPDNYVEFERDADSYDSVLEE